MNRVSYGHKASPAPGFQGFIKYGPYRANYRGVEYGYWDEPEAVIEGHFQRYLEWKANETKPTIVTVCNHRKYYAGHDYIGYCMYPWFKSWWYNPIEWGIKFPWRVWRWLRLVPPQQKLFGTIQAFGVLNDWIFPSNWMIRYQEWVWRTLAGDRLEFIGWFVRDTFDGFDNHPESLQVIHK